MKTIRVLLALMALSVLGQASTSTIHGVVNYGTGQAVVGTVTVSWPSFTSDDGFVPPGKTTAAIANSHYTVTLRPNTASGVYYTAEIKLTNVGGITWTEKWLITSTSTDSETIRIATTEGYNPQTGSVGPRGDTGPAGLSWINDPTLRPIFGEVPTSTGTYTYTLSAPALAPGYACYYNGLRMKVGLDFTVSGRTITAGHQSDGTSFWDTTDTANILQCDYTYQVTP